LVDVDRDRRDLRASYNWEAAPMSIAIMSQVWKHSKQEGGALLVLLALADFANDEGICYPAQHTLAKKSRLSARQVRRVLSDLIASGELSIVRAGRGRGLKTIYRVLGKADNMTAFEKADICDTKSGHLEHLKADTGDRTVRQGTVKESPTRASARGGVSKKLWIRKQLRADLAELSTEIDAIRRPGGSAYPINPTDPAKFARLGKLVERHATLSGQLAAAAG
jgi:helix-turn-helix protein